MPTIYIMVGLPRSGKSTIIRERKPAGAVIVSADEIRKLVYNQRFWAEGEPFMWSIREFFLRYMFHQGVDIVIDETNTTKKRREPIIREAKKYGYRVVAWVVEGPTATDCCRRAKDTGQEDLIPVIQRMAEQFELPSRDEGFDDLVMV